MVANPSCLEFIRQDDDDFVRSTPRQSCANAVFDLIVYSEDRKQPFDPTKRVFGIYVMMAYNLMGIN